MCIYIYIYIYNGRACVAGIYSRLFGAAVDCYAASAALLGSPLCIYMPLPGTSRVVGGRGREGAGGGGGEGLCRDSGLNYGCGRWNFKLATLLFLIR